MRVTFRAIAGPMTGREFVVRAAELVNVGRTDWADVAFPGDDRMSSVHFSVESDLKSTYIKDVGSTNGTFVNGQRIKQRQLLEHGDEVVAGDTSFRVSIVGEELQASKGTTVTSQSIGVAPANDAAARRAAAVAPFHKGQRPSYAHEQCASGLTLCRGEIGDLSAAGLAIQVATKLPARLVVDFHRLEQSPPAELEKAEYLFDWFEPQVAKIASPMLVSQEQFAAWPTLIEDSWGKDAMACYFSTGETNAVWTHLRHACCGKRQGDGPPKSVLGIYWPTVLTYLLAHSAAHATHLMEGIDAILTELPDMPDTWQLFGRQDLPDQLDQLGFQRQEPRT